MKKSLKRILKKKNKSASYCCEAAYTINAKKLPVEKAFK